MRKTYKITYLKHGSHGHHTAIVEAFNPVEARNRLCQDITGDPRLFAQMDAKISIIKVEELKF